MMRFGKCDDEPIGVYPIVDRADKLIPLYECGITTAQLRIKDLTGSDLVDEIKSGIQISREHDARFFVNDYWRLAVEHGAYGVHLGQEDIEDADLDIIYSAGLRLGISSHTPDEIANALSFAPSYLAIGPLYEPISKKMTYDNVGLERLEAWAVGIEYPIVGIGGITQDNIAQVASTGVLSGVAMISAVLDGDSISRPKTMELIRLWQS